MLFKLLMLGSLRFAAAYRLRRQNSDGIADFSSTSVLDDHCTEDEKNMIISAYKDAAQVSIAATDAWTLAKGPPPDRQTQALDRARWLLTRSDARWLFGLDLNIPSHEQGLWSQVGGIYDAQHSHFLGLSAFPKPNYYCNSNGKEAKFYSRDEKDPDSAFPDKTIGELHPNLNRPGIWSFRGIHIHTNPCPENIIAQTIQSTDGATYAMEGIFLCNMFFNKPGDAVAKISANPTSHGLSLDTMRKDRAFTLTHEHMHYFGTLLLPEPLIDQPAVDKEGRPIYLNTDGSRTYTETDTRDVTYGLASTFNLAKYSGAAAAVSSADPLALMAWTQFASANTYQPAGEMGAVSLTYMIMQRLQGETTG